MIFTIILLILLILLTIGFVIFIIYHFNHQKQNKTIGIRYKENESVSINTIMQRLQDLMSFLQKEGCKSINESLTSILFVIDQAKFNLDCNQIIKIVNEEIRNPSNTDTDLPVETRKYYDDTLISIFNDIIKASCVKGKLDNNRLKFLLSGIVKSTCDYHNSTTLLDSLKN